MKLPPAAQARWEALAPRERLLVLAAAALVGLALIWWLTVAPALKTLRGSAEQHRTLDAQLQRMRAMATQAQALQAQPKLAYDEALRALELSTRQRLGATAQLSVVGERASITLRAAPPDALAQWLAQVRLNARALPSEARLTRGAAATGGWDGTIVLNLPPR